MRLLVTGARGFIGRSLVGYLSQRHDVTWCGRDELDLLEPFDVEYFLKEGQYNAVIHAAGYDANSPVVKRDRTIALEVNLRMFTNLIRCSDWYDRLIYFGSGSEVEKDFRKLHMDELDCCWHVPNDSYGLSKWLMNKVAPFDGKITNVRLFGVFGELDDWRYRVVPNLCAQALYFDKLVLKRNAMHDFMYIEDLCSAVEILLLQNRGNPYSSYNVCPSNPVTFRRLAEIVSEVRGGSLGIECPDEMFHSYCGSNKRFLNEFPNFRFTPMEIAIKSLYEWYSDHRDEIPKDEVMKWL